MELMPPPKVSVAVLASSTLDEQVALFGVVADGRDLHAVEQAETFEALGRLADRRGVEEVAGAELAELADDDLVFGARVAADLDVAEAEGLALVDLVDELDLAGLEAESVARA